MKKQITFITLILIFKLGISQELKKDNYETVKTFVDFIKNNEIDKIKTLITYPLRREYPLSDIDNEIEFEKRYTEIFDDSLKNMIISSNIDTDWSAVGWRGIMFNNGDLWLNYDSRLLSVNYQSGFEQDKRIELIKKDKTYIHESLKDFEEPILIIETKKFKIRIDKLYNAKYRYASWSIDSTMSEKPDLIINDGNWISEGSGGNHRYEFINRNYKYDCIINILGAADTPPAELVVYQDDKKILNEQGQIKRK
ncbi:hypothetical protein [uncultured Sunxiuqinia sp.]|uniref:hypothetical protein n=1 Tax=uncultured Sunxiuqinia sp. TaxID=1573825 RepID=UPI002AA8CB8F|nr:hypothetical protein [uncultured Sunxiuqinia sp.]